VSNIDFSLKFCRANWMKEKCSFFKMVPFMDFLGVKCENPFLVHNFGVFHRGKWLLGFFTIFIPSIDWFPSKMLQRIWIWWKIQNFFFHFLFFFSCRFFYNPFFKNGEWLRQTIQLPRSSSTLLIGNTAVTGQYNRLLALKSCVWFACFTGRKFPPKVRWKMENFPTFKIPNFLKLFQ
jgi:hypothetical protein